jgi:hypothetical protein
MRNEFAVAAQNTETVVNALIDNARRLLHELYKSLTWDRGSELAGHKRFTLATDIQVYFCDPQNPWQRGSNENTNGLLRQYFPKGLDISTYSQEQLDAVARRLANVCFTAARCRWRAPPGVRVCCEHYLSALKNDCPFWRTSGLFEEQPSFLETE